ncbi:hypothetical protein, partial [Zavarzinella formosa]|uniref:hypothetical protein n=1 Tax=Zavarzinella formosa TaxID=360055 RepID=UPI00187DB8F0
ADITSFLIEGDRLSWTEVTDRDLAGYLIRFQPGTSRSWGDAGRLHVGLVTASPFTMLTRPSGPVTFMIKARDT